MGDAVAEGLALRQRQALERLPAALLELPAATVPMVASDLTGLDALRALAGAHAFGASPAAPESVQIQELPPLESLLAELAAAGHGVVLVMGKGGVGKTMVAAEIALGLGRLGHRVHLSTTDPAGDPASEMVLTLRRA
jgi:arsenite-transporting ATPase